MPATDIQLCSKLTLFGRNAFQRLQHQARGQRQVEKTWASKMP